MRRPALLLMLLLFAPAAASAHHSLAPYAMAELRTVEGTVKTLDWSNPHVRINLLVAEVNGKYSEWEFEGGSVSRLTSGGLTKDAIAPGDRITVHYNPRRDHSIGGFFVAVTTANGTTYSTDRFRNFSGKKSVTP
jgi:hypothetical protein